MEEDQHSSMAERALDLLVFAPAGAVLRALEDVPGTAERGRAMIEQELRNAHLVGQFAVGASQRRLLQGLERLTSASGRGGGANEPGGTDDQAEPGTTTPAAAGSAPVQPLRVEPSRPEPRAPVPARPVGAPVDAPDADGITADLAIPGYDTLSASQVVRRLDGLGPDELAAVFRHEAASRGRRTILHRAQQLLGPAAPPSGA
ncbi:MAG: hypothetical protein ACRDYZ_00520 [Acidimicrobiales bacterium]